MPPNQLTADEIEARQEVIEDMSIDDPEPPAIDPTVHLTLDLSTLPDDPDFALVVERLNEALLAISFLCETAGITESTLAMVTAKTKYMRGAYVKPKQSEKPKEPGLGAHELERPAVTWLKERLQTWTPGQRYVVLSTLTDEVRAAGLFDRRGRPFDQSQVATLVKMGGKYKGRFD